MKYPHGRGRSGRANLATGMMRFSLIGTGAAALALATGAVAKAAPAHAVYKAPAAKAHDPAIAAPQEMLASGPVLTFEDALALASGSQPSVAAYQSEAIASEHAAVAARSLPDPQLQLGVQDFPVSGHTAFSPTNDNFTMYNIGIMREQVRRSKREAAAAQLQAEAVVSREQASEQDLQIRHDVMIAWINAVEAAAKQPTSPVGSEARRSVRFPTPFRTWPLPPRCRWTGWTSIRTSRWPRHRSRPPSGRSMSRGPRGGPTSTGR